MHNVNTVSRQKITQRSQQKGKPRNSRKETEQERMRRIEKDRKAKPITVQIPDEIKQERYDRLMTLQQRISLKRNQARVGQIEKVLITDVHPDGKTCLGRSEREAPETDGEILIDCRALKPETGRFIPVRITGAHPYDLMGEAL